MRKGVGAVSSLDVTKEVMVDLCLNATRGRLVLRTFRIEYL